MEQSILVVEDDQVNREFLASYLGGHGYTVRAVGTGEEALSALETDGYALVLLDLMLPGKNGGEVAWAARARGVTTPIVAVSAAMDQWVLADLIDLGITETLEKPFGNDQLLALVRRYAEAAGS